MSKALRYICIMLQFQWNIRVNFFPFRLFSLFMFLISFYLKERHEISVNWDRERFCTGLIHVLIFHLCLKIMPRPCLVVLSMVINLKSYWIRLRLAPNFRIWILFFWNPPNMSPNKIKWVLIFLMLACIVSSDEFEFVIHTSLTRSSEKSVGEYSQ